MSGDADFDADFDVIIVGAGPAGSATAYRLARAGLSVLLIDRGVTPGSKNISGGVLYSAVLQDLIPGFYEEAPVERPITRHLTTFITKDASCSLDYRSVSLAEPPYNAFSVLRSRFDSWFAGRAEEAGCFLMPGIRVDAPLLEDGRVAGVIAGGDTLRAPVVVAADGVNSFLAQRAGLRSPNRAPHVALGVKTIIKLARSVIEDRFALSGDEGAACAFVGDVTKAVPGGGFVYTNVESLSVGVVVRVDHLAGTPGVTPAGLLEEFLAHPLVEPLLRGGERAEYAAHLVPEGGEAMVGRLVSNGFVIVGDAAGLALNNGLVVRGMDLAIGSGICAAEAIIQAHETGDFSAAGLRSYEQRLRESFVMRDLHTYARAPSFLGRSRLYSTYPQFITGLMYDVFRIDGRPKRRLAATARRAMKASGLGAAALVGDAYAAMRAL